MASMEKEKYLQIGLNTNDELPRRHISENYFIGTIRTIFKTLLNIFGSILIVSYLISSSFCILREDISRAYVTSAFLAGAGACCIILGFYSSKLTITGGSRLGFLVCAILFLNQHSPKCAGPGDMYAMGPEQRMADWQMRLQTLQGGVILVSIVQIFVGLIGIDILAKYFRPVSVSSTMILLSTYVMKTGAPTLADGCWKLFFFTCFLMFFFYFVFYRFSNCIDIYGKRIIRIGLRQELFVGSLAVIFIWLLCAIFSNYGWIHLKIAARTDIYNGALISLETFKPPHIFEWGWPEFKLNSFFIMLPAVYISVFEMLANYYVCSESKSAADINSQLSRKFGNIWSTYLLFEGIFSMMTSSIVPGLGVTVELKSRNQRLSGIFCGIILIIGSACGYICALMTTIPEPIMSAFIFLIFLSVCFEGFSLFQCINMNLTRNHCILGLSLFSGLLIPEFTKKVSYIHLFGNPLVDEVFWSIISTEFLIGGIIAVILDNMAKVFFGADSGHSTTCEKNQMKEHSSDSIQEESSLCNSCFLFFV